MSLANAIPSESELEQSYDRERAVFSVFHHLPVQYCLADAIELVDDHPELVNGEATEECRATLEHKRVNPDDVLARISNDD